jgi:hypothetical protein
MPGEYLEGANTKTSLSTELTDDILAVRAARADCLSDRAHE